LAQVYALSVTEPIATLEGCLHFFPLKEEFRKKDTNVGTGYVD